MNHPARPLDDELRAIATGGWDFVDLTFEPPQGWPVDGARVGRMLRDLGLTAVGHTAYYLPIASALDELRAAAQATFLAACREFAAAGVTLVNVHPDPMNRMFAADEIVERNADALAALAEGAAELGVELMVENMGRSFFAPELLAPIFDAAEGLRFHLDIGHANMAGPTAAAALIEAFGDRLAHVHLHDNLGVDDLHLPLGAGTVDWPATARALRLAGYDATFTLEVFSPAREHAESSRRLWERWWTEADG